MPEHKPVQFDDKPLMSHDRQACPGYQMRLAQAADLPFLQKLFEEARQFMREQGNQEQWTEGYPDEALLLDDILRSQGFICMENGEPKGYVCLQLGVDPAYEGIDGLWLDDDPYASIHRIAVLPGTKGGGRFMMDWCLNREDNIRIDTHKDNQPMRHLLDALAFTYCGVAEFIYGSRVAYQKKRRL